MRIVFTGCDNIKKSKDHSSLRDDSQIRKKLWQNYENGQIIAFAKWLKLNTNHKPCFLLEKDSQCIDALKEAELDFFEINAGLSLLNNLRLWRWQKKIAALRIIYYGKGQKIWAKRLAKMRKTDNAHATTLYYTPEEVEKDNLIGNRNFLCASELVVRQINKFLKDMKKEFVESATRSFLPGLNLKAYKQAQPWQDEGKDKHFVFGMAGSLLPDSGALEIIRAMAAMWQKDDLPAWEVRMFGSGSALPEILEEAEKLGVSTRLSLLSAQPLEEVAQYCHAWLAPGHSQTELPACLWTAFAAGLPLICSDTPLHRNWLAWAENSACFVPSENPQQLAHAMIKIIKNQDIRENLARRGRLYRDNLDLDRMSERIWSILNKLSFLK